MKRNVSMDNSKVREFMFYRTGNQVLIDSAMKVAAGLIGFGDSLKTPEENDRVFIQKFIRLPMSKIENNAILMGYHDSMRKDIVRLILDVRMDLVGAV